MQRDVPRCNVDVYRSVLMLVHHLKFYWQKENYSLTTHKISTAEHGGGGGGVNLCIINRMYNMLSLKRYRLILASHICLNIET